MGNVVGRYLGETENGRKVFDRPKSHLKIADELLKEALQKITPSKDYEKFVVKFPRIIGEKRCVKVTERDKVIKVIRKGKKHATPMVLYRMPELCDSVIIVLLEKEDGNYILITAYVGDEGEPEPWHKDITENSISFWKTHALIYDPDDVERHLCKKDSYT